MRLPGLVGELIKPLTEQREAQHRTLSLYQRTAVTNQAADHAVLNM